jgi:hypothetical protein
MLPAPAATAAAAAAAAFLETAPRLWPWPFRRCRCTCILLYLLRPTASCAASSAVLARARVRARDEASGCCAGPRAPRCALQSEPPSAPALLQPTPPHPTHHTTQHHTTRPRSRHCHRLCLCLCLCQLFHLRLCLRLCCPYCPYSQKNGFRRWRWLSWYVASSRCRSIGPINRAEQPPQRSKHGDDRKIAHTADQYNITRHGAGPGALGIEINWKMWKHQTRWFTLPMPYN